MNAPLVYGHPDTWSGFWYVVLGQQFGGSLDDPWDDLPTKAADTAELLAGWLGPLGYFAALGIGTSVIRRPRYVLLSGVARLATCCVRGFLCQRGHRALLPGAAVRGLHLGRPGTGRRDLVWRSGAVGAASEFVRRRGRAAAERRRRGPAAPAASPSPGPAGSSVWQVPAALAVEAVIAVALIVANVDDRARAPAHAGRQPS